MKKKTKKILKITGIVIGAIILIILLLLFFKVPVIPTTTNGTIITGGSSGGGGGSTSTPSDEGLIFVPLGNLFSWFIPIDDSVDEATEETTNIWDNFIDAVSLKADGSSCSSNSQCLSGYCDLVTYATGGKCRSMLITERTDDTEDLRTIPLTSECTRDSDCNKCANPDYDTCVSNKCECIAPTTRTTSTCSDSDKTTSLFTRTTTDINYEQKGTCLADSTSRGVTDYCRNGLLIEYYCGNDGCLSENAVDCKVKLNRDDAVCYDGMCTWLA